MAAPVNQTTMNAVVYGLSIIVAPIMPDDYLPGDRYLADILLSPHEGDGVKGLKPQQVLNGIDAAEGLEREILVVHNHPVLALLAAQAFDVGKHRDGHDDLAAVGQVGRHCATLHIEVQFLDAQVGVLEFAHIVVLLLFNAFNLYLLAGKHVVDEAVQFAHVAVVLFVITTAKIQNFLEIIAIPLEKLTNRHEKGRESHFAAGVKSFFFSHSRTGRS